MTSNRDEQDRTVNSTKPPTRNDDEWLKIKQALEDYGFLKDGLAIDIASKLPHNYFRIDSNLEIEAKSNLSRQVGVLPQQVEVLLPQVTQLLESAIVLRNQWNELAVRMFEVGLNASEFTLLDEIHTKEKEAGFYLIDALQSEATAKSEQKYLEAATESSKMLTSLLNDHFNQYWQDRLWKLAHVRATTSCHPMFEKELEGKGNPQLYDGDPNVIPGKYNKTQWMQMTEVEPTVRQFGIEKLNSEIGLHWNEANTKMSEIRNIAVSSKHTWESKNVHFRQDRTGVSKNLAALKIKAATEDGGVLNYPERMESIRRRFVRDFGDAIEKLKVASEGLTKIYNYPTPFPDDLTELLQKGQTNKPVFENSLIWVQDALSWLGEMSTIEQTCIWPLSVKDLVKNDDWRDSIESGMFKFKISEDRLPNACMLRLRGMSLYVETKIPNDIWQATVSVPRVGKIYFRDGADREIEQAMPACIIGRARSILSDTQADVSGAASLRNVCPIGATSSDEDGKWSIQLPEKSFKGTPRAKILDVIIELHICFFARSQEGVGE